MERPPVWFVERKSEPGAWNEVAFSWIYPNKVDVKSVGLIFLFNSYRIYSEDISFSINGGTRIKLGEVISDAEVVCIQRHAKSMVVGGDGKGTEEISYLLGFQGKDAKGVAAEIYVHVSPDGKEFRWLNHR